MKKTSYKLSLNDVGGHLMNPILKFQILLNCKNTFEN